MTKVTVNLNCITSKEILRYLKNQEHLKPTIFVKLKILVLQMLGHIFDQQFPTRTGL